MIKAKAKLLAMINTAIDNGSKMNITISCLEFGVCATIIPDAIDEGENNVIVYSGSDTYSISLFGEFDEEDRYICLHTDGPITHAVMIITF